MKASVANIGLRNAVTPTWCRSIRARYAPPVPVRQAQYPHPLAGNNLPGAAQEIADVIGRERALYLIGQLPRCYVGREGAKSYQVMLYVPKTLKPNHPLVVILGMDDAQALVDAFGGEQLKPPTCAEVYRQFRDAAIPALLAGGLSPEFVAEITAATVPIVVRLAKNAARRQ